jgi:hypothetical protein
MRHRLRSSPAWLIVVVFGSAAVLVRLLADATPDSVQLIAGLLLLVALIAALILRGDSDGWGIYGTMVLFSLALQAVDWPLIAEAPLFTLGSAALVWAFFDRPKSGTDPSAGIGDRQQACG